MLASRGWQCFRFRQWWYWQNGKPAGKWAQHWVYRYLQSTWSQHVGIKCQATRGLYILFLPYIWDRVIHRHLITLQDGAYHCRLNAEVQFRRRRDVTARNACTAKTAAGVQSQTLAPISCTLSTQPPPNDSMRCFAGFRVLPKLFAVIKWTRHWQQTCWFQGALRIQMHGWLRRPRNFENNTSLVFDSYRVASAVFQRKESINKVLLFFPSLFCDVHTLHTQTTKMRRVGCTLPKNSAAHS